MSPDPALSPDTWRRWRGFPIRARTLTVERVTEMTGQDLAGSIALLHDMLPDSDERKIKREWVEWLRGSADVLKRAKDRKGAAMAGEIANALEAYLQPESTDAT